MIPLSATHKLKKEHENGPFCKYVKYVGSTYYGTNDWDVSWFLDKRIADFIDYYDKIEDLTITKKESEMKTETPEEKEALDAIKKKSPYDVGAHCSGLGKPLFTQEFAVRGGSSIPLVWEPCKVKYNGSKYVVLVDINGREYSRRKVKLMIRDIDTRTPKQKAVDEMPSSQDLEALFWEYDDKSSRDGCTRIAFKNAVKKAIKQNQSELYDAGYRKY